MWPSTVGVVVALLASDYAIYLGLGFLWSGNINSIWKEDKNKSRFSRYLVDLAIMLYFSGAGFLALSEYGGHLVPRGVSLYKSGGLGSYAVSLCTIQLAYELKSLIDAVIHKDDLVYFMHHLATGLLAYIALSTGFCQKYASFFFGISEISTAAVCVVVCFDKKRGIIGLSTLYPTLEIIAGVIFALLFVVCRIIIWPYVSFYFWKDCLELLQSGTAVSQPVVYLFLVTNFLLTILQLAWLGEIIQGALKLFGKPERSLKAA